MRRTDGESDVGGAGRQWLESSQFEGTEGAGGLLRETALLERWKGTAKKEGRGGPTW